MQVRAARFIDGGRIDCEIEHPEYGWIPFTAAPDDPELHGRELFEQLRGFLTAQTEQRQCLKI